MSELRQSVTHTVYPNGKVVRHYYGMIPSYAVPTAELARKVNIWRRWLAILKAKYHWTDQLKQHLYED